MDQERVSFGRLHSGDWGVFGALNTLKPGRLVTVTKKSGETTQVTVGEVVWDNGMEGIATIKKKERVPNGGKLQAAINHAVEDKPEQQPGTPYRPDPSWGACNDCGAPGSLDSRGLGLSCGCAF